MATPFAAQQIIVCRSPASWTIRCAPTSSERGAGSPRRTQLRLRKTHTGRGEDRTTVPSPARHPAAGARSSAGRCRLHHLRGNRVTSGGLHRPIAHSPPQRFMADVDLGPDPGPDPGPRGRRGSGRLLLFTQSVASLQGAVALGWALPANASSSPLGGDSDYFGSWNTRSIHSLIRFSKQTFSVKTKSGGGGGA